jgi:hypothetical protein
MQPGPAASCYACMSRPDLSDAAKAWCVGCSSWYEGSEALRLRCHECLRAQGAAAGGDFVGACARLDRPLAAGGGVNASAAGNATRDLPPGVVLASANLSTRRPAPAGAAAAEQLPGAQPEAAVG